MNQAASIAPIPLQPPVKQMLSPEESKLVNLIANAIVDYSINLAYENQEGNYLHQD